MSHPSNAAAIRLQIPQVRPCDSKQTKNKGYQLKKQLFFGGGLLGLTVKFQIENHHHHPAMVHEMFSRRGAVLYVADLMVHEVLSFSIESASPCRGV